MVALLIKIKVTSLASYRRFLKRSCGAESRKYEKHFLPIFFDPRQQTLERSNDMARPIK